jgi:VWFA-related protein
MPCSVVLLALALAPALTAQSNAPAPSPEAAHAQATPAGDSVVVDLVVRDKKDVPLADLRADEIEIDEDGVKQTLAGFERATSGAPGNLALLIPRLSAADRDMAQHAADELLKRQLVPGIRVAVLSVGPELVSLQDYTTDATALRDAVKRALDPATSSGELSIDALWSFVRGSKDPAGRKAAVIFASGLGVSPGSESLIGALSARANRSRVGFYAVDPRGLEISKRPIDVTGGTGEEEITGWMHGHLEETQGNAQARTDPRWQDPRAGGEAGRGPEAALETVTRLTGGFVVARTNNFSKGMHQIVEDLGSHYELSYTPSTTKADGSVRRLEIKVAREGARVQAGRDVLVGAVTAPPPPEFEKPLLAALEGQPLPQDVELWDRAFHFAWDGKELQHVLRLAVPLATVSLAEEAAKFRGEVGVLARVKDTSGRVVASFSQDFPLVGPIDQLARARTQSIAFVRRVKLVPGSYTLEAAVEDVASGKAAARRTAFTVQAPESLGLSSVSLGELKPASPGSDASDPFRVKTDALAPNLGQPIKAGGSPMTLHCVVYPVPGSKAPANVSFTLRSGGNVLMNQTAPLPAADASGRISYGSALRVDLIPAGTYQMTVSVEQGSSKAEESTPFTIVP